MKYLQKYEACSEYTYKEWDELYNKIKSYPVKYKISTTYLDSSLQEDGLTTAFNISRIANFYRDYNHMKHKRSYILNGPVINDTKLYDKITDIIRYCKKIYVPKTGTTTLLFPATDEWKIPSFELRMRMLMNLLAAEQRGIS